MGMPRICSLRKSCVHGSMCCPQRQAAAARTACGLHVGMPLLLRRPRCCHAAACAPGPPHLQDRVEILTAVHAGQQHVPARPAAYEMGHGRGAARCPACCPGPAPSPAGRCCLGGLGVAHAGAWSRYVGCMPGTHGRVLVRGTAEAASAPPRVQSSCQATGCSRGRQWQPQRRPQRAWQDRAVDPVRDRAARVAPRVAGCTWPRRSLMRNIRPTCWRQLGWGRPRRAPGIWRLRSALAVALPVFTA